MTDVKWIKIVTDIFDDEKIILIEAMPEADAIIVIWFKVLCMAGKQNNGGVLMLNNRMPYTDEMLSTIFRRSLPVVRLALSTFERLGMIEIVSGAVTIPNWGKHQNLEGIQARRNYMAGYMRDYREKQKQIASPTDSKHLHKPNVSDAEGEREEEVDKNKNNNSADKPRRFDGEFDVFWTSYPRKTAKQDAKKAFDALMKQKDAPSIERLVESVEAHKKTDAWKKDGGQFIPHPATYLRQGRYDDELSVKPSDPQTLTAHIDGTITRPKVRKPILDKDEKFIGWEDE